MPCLECCGRIGRKAQNLPPTLCMCSSVSPASPSSIPLLSITRLEPCVCKSWIVKLRDMSSGLLNWKRRKIISLKCLPYGNFFQNGAQPCSYHRFYKREFLSTIYSHHAGGKENLCDKNEVDENLLLLDGLLVFYFQSCFHGTHCSEIAFKLLQ